MPFLTLKELILKPFADASVVNEAFRRDLHSSDEELRVFLFYQAGDKEKLSSVVNILKSLRLNLYIDYVEAGILENPQHDTLQIIKNRLYQANKAILLATPRYLIPNGYPPEYGLNGKFQFTRKVAIFPVTDQPSLWEDKDIYRSYGYIQKKYSLFNFPDDWQVIFPEGDRMLLKEWLTK